MTPATGGDGPVGDHERDALLVPLAPYPVIVLAVSGGSDSTALLHLVHGWNRDRVGARASVVAVTVDHGLRAESAAEAEAVARQASALGIEHRIARWNAPRPASGLQAAARIARYRLLAAVAQEKSAGAGSPVAVVTAHTADDQAETFLMRLARGSGVDGLAAISADRELPFAGSPAEGGPIRLLRPLLAVPRRRLIATLAAGAIPYAEDPSNRDRRFERVRVRDALDVLASLGLGRDALQRSAHRLQMARDVLEAAADDLEARAVTVHAGLVTDIDLEALASAPRETAVRVVRRVLSGAQGAGPAAELGAIEAAVARILDVADMSRFTLGGCVVEVERSGDDFRAVIRIYREPGRDGGLPTVQLAPGATARWDERFYVAVSATFAGRVDVGPLAADWRTLLAEVPALARARLPRDAAWGAPAFRDGEKVLAVPLLAGLLLGIGEVEAARRLAGPLEWRGDGDETPALRVVPVKSPVPRRAWRQRPQKPL